MKNEIKFLTALKAKIKSVTIIEGAMAQCNRRSIEDCAEAFYGNLLREEFLSTEDPLAYAYDLWLGKLSKL